MSRFIAKSILLLALVVAAQAGIYASRGADRKFFPKDLKEFHRRLSEPVDLVYFGDSVNRAVGPTDSDPRAISTVLADLSRLRMAEVDHAAYQMSVYLSYFRNLLERGVRPRAIVVPVNMRSFSVGWQFRPEWQFEKERALLEHDHFLFRAFFKPLAALKAFPLNSVSQGEYDAMPVMDGATPVGAVRDFTGTEYGYYTDERMRKKWVFNYMYRLTPDHAFVRSMAAVARLAKKEGVRAVFYVTPVDFESGEKYLGGRFAPQVRENVAVVAEALSAEGSEVLDLSERLPAKAFIWRVDVYPNEHLNDTGRRFLAAKVAERL